MLTRTLRERVVELHDRSAAGYKYKDWMGSKSATYLAALTIKFAELCNSVRATPQCKSAKSFENLHEMLVGITTGLQLTGDARE